MRTGVVIAGALVLALGFAMAGVGGAMKTVGDACIAARCTEEDALMVGMFGTGLLYGGFLLGLGGIGLLVAGVLAQPAPKRVAVAPSAARPCPSCAQPLTPDARVCAACGSAVAPIVTTRA